MLSGGSTASTSLIWFAITFTEQTVASGRSLVGSRVIEEPGEPLTEKLSGVPVGHSSVNELADAVRVVAAGRSVLGSSVIVEVAVPLAPKAWLLPRAGHSIVNELVPAFTG